MTVLIKDVIGVVTPDFLVIAILAPVAKEAQAGRYEQQYYDSDQEP